MSGRLLVVSCSGVVWNSRDDKLQTVIEVVKSTLSEQPYHATEIQRTTDALLLQVMGKY